MKTDYISEILGLNEIEMTYFSHIKQLLSKKREHEIDPDYWANTGVPYRTQYYLFDILTDISAKTQKRRVSEEELSDYIKSYELDLRILAKRIESERKHFAQYVRPTKKTNKFHSSEAVFRKKRYNRTRVID